MTTPPDTPMAFCSGPFWSDTWAIRETGAAELLRESARRLGEHPGVVIGAPPELRSALTEIALQTSFDRPTWSPSVGRAYAALHDPGRDRPIAAVADLVFDFIEAVSPFSCAVELEMPRRLIADPLVLPLSSRVKVAWRAPTLTLEAGGSTFVLDIQPSRRALSPSSPPLSALVGLFETAGELGVLRDGTGSVFPPLDGAPAAIGAREACSSVEAGLDLLRQTAPEYLEWILPVVRWTIPVSAPPGEFASGSGPHTPGVVAVSVPCDALTVAESLVHETAHQYFFFASRFSRLTAPDDRLYRSPLAGRDRPLDMILAAFHAAANIAAFYGLVAERCPDLAASESATAHITDDCRVLTGHLRYNDRLTDLGRNVFDPIRSWLTGRGLL